MATAIQGINAERLAQNPVKFSTPAATLNPAASIFDCDKDYDADLDKDYDKDCDKDYDKDCDYDADYDYDYDRDCDRDYDCDYDA